MEEEQELDSLGAEVLDSQIVMVEEDMCGQVVDKMEDKQAVDTILEGHMKMEEVEVDTEPGRIGRREEQKLEEADRKFLESEGQGEEEEEQALEDHSLSSQEEDNEVGMVVLEAGTKGEEAVVRTRLEVEPVLVEDRDHLDPKHLQEEGGRMMAG